MSSNQVALAEVGIWSSGGTPSSGNSIYYGGDIPWAVIGDLNDSTVMSTERSITEMGLAESSAKIVPAGTLMIAMYATSIGKLGLAGKPMATNQAIGCCQPNSGVDVTFLMAFLRAIRPELSAMAKGGAQQNISQGVLKALRIPHGGKKEESRFVSIVQGLLERTLVAQSLQSRRHALTESILASALNDSFGQLN
jgi:type I restriction enzyme, S subunit